MRTTSVLSCVKCGKPVLRGARFCMACGSQVPDTDPGDATVAGTPGGGLSEVERQMQLQQLLIDATLGEFEVLGELGRGGMATVFLAHDMALERKVAIKVIAPALLSAAGATERFKREARTAASLSHPHIIPIHAVRETPELLYFVMKFVEGRPLDDIIRERGPLPIRMVEAILFEVGQALAYAHRRNVVHRDIKPANIMLDVEGWAVVTDFGIAKVLEADSLTVSGSMIGTPYYMSPEQCAGKPVSGTSDQYSLAVVAYEMLTGRPPFSGETIMEIMKGHFFEAPPPLLDGRPDCTPDLADLIDRMMAKEAAARFGSMDEVLAAMSYTSLASDDPVRGEMVELARSNDALQAMSRLSIPISPVPVTRMRARGTSPRAPATQAAEPAQEQEQEASPAEAPPSRLKLPLMIVGGLGILALAGAGAAALMRPAVEAPVTPPVTQPAVVESPAAPSAMDSFAVAPPPVDSAPPPSADPPPATSAPVAAAPAAESAAERAERRAREEKLYVAKVQRALTAAWRASPPEDVDSAASVQVTLVIGSGGSREGQQWTKGGDDRLQDFAIDALENISSFDPLPPVLGRSVTLIVTFTPNKVSVAGS